MNQQMLGGTNPETLATFYLDKKNGNFTLLGLSTFAPTEKHVPVSEWDRQDALHFKELRFLQYRISNLRLSLFFSDSDLRNKTPYLKDDINTESPSFNVFEGAIIPNISN